MKAAKIDFSELEIREIGSWPLMLRAGVIALACIISIALIYFLLLQSQFKSLSQEATKETTKKNEFKEKYNLAANLDAYQKQMVEINDAYKELTKALPTDSNVPELIEQISKIAEANNLKYESIRLGEAANANFYKELPIDLNLIGKYHDFAKFAQDLTRLPRIVTMHDFSITKANEKTGDGNDLKMTVKVKTYWLASEAEISKAQAPTPGNPPAPGAPVPDVGNPQVPQTAPRVPPKNPAPGEVNQ